MHKPDAVDQPSIDGLVALTHELTGITIKPERQVMLVGRLRRRMSELGLSGLKDYLDHARRHQDEHEHLINQITTNETYFFRTPRVWDYIEQRFLPAWLRQCPGQVLRAWSAASSTGEEAYTLGILLQHCRTANPGFDYRIEGTDVDTSVIGRAAAGTYGGRSIARFRQARPEWFQRYMHGDDDNGYSVVPDIRKRVQFKRLNLFDPPSTALRYDLVLVRNVLIYFTHQDQEKVMASVYRRISASGTVIIGESESLNNLRTDFEAIAPTIYRPLASADRRAA